MQELSVSFIIPAYNEELFLPQVLESIKLYMPETLAYEIIVADNGSEDNTVSLAETAGAKVVVNKDAKISELRNLAVEIAKGRVLVFLDADILLTVEWGQNFLEVYESLLHEPIQVTGSRCGIPTNPSWIEEIWFGPLIIKPGQYINSGHLITSRELFDRVGGFDVTLETGEDYALGQAASHIKAKITNNPLLVVIHKGYPKTIYQFMRREMWHGRGDCTSFHRLRASKVALASILFVSLHVFAGIGIVNHEDTIVKFLFLLIIVMCVCAAVIKHDARTIKNIVLNSLLYYFYFISRFLSCLSFLSSRSVTRKEDN